MALVWDGPWVGPTQVRIGYSLPHGNARTQERQKISNESFVLVCVRHTKLFVDFKMVSGTKMVHPTVSITAATVGSS